MLLVLFALGTGIIIYLVMWLIVPKKPERLQDQMYKRGPTF
jgi:phage shock protein PspC (stress-responsive transcriptional regulator)